MGDHAKLSASGSSKWMNCPGSISLEKGLPNESSKFAAEGTAAHELATWCLEDGVQALHYLGEKIDVEGFLFVVDHEMVDAVQTYVDFCHSLEGEHEWVEERVEYTDWVEGGFGTSDHIKIQILQSKEHDHHVINVTDLKYGKGVKVYAEWNSQAMIYGLGVLQSFSHLFDFRDTDIVNCVIVQPRLDHIDEFKISVGDLRAWAEKELAPKALEALGDDPSFHPGEKQCRFCLAKATCRALAAESLKTVFSDFSVIGADFGTGTYTARESEKLTSKELGDLMELIPTMLAWANSIEAHAFNELNAGRTVPGYKLVTGKAGNKAFTESKTALLLDDLEACGLKEEDVFKPRDFKSPTQIEKILKANKAEDLERSLFKDLWTQSAGRPTIAKESDKREAIQPQVKEDFGKIE